MSKSETKALRFLFAISNGLLRQATAKFDSGEIDAAITLLEKSETVRAAAGNVLKALK